MPRYTSSQMPQDSLLVTRYADLELYVRAWAAGQVNLLIVVGPAGRGKTTTVLKALEARDVPYGMIAGRATAYRFYCECFQYKDCLIVLDDADPVMASRDGMAVVKSLTDTRPTKTMRWNSRINGEDVPTEFDTTSRVCVLVNSWAEGKPDYDAVANRGNMIFFSPSPDEIMRNAEQWADRRVLDAVRPLLPFFDDLNLRLFQTAREQLSIGGGDPGLMNNFLRSRLATGAKGHAITLLLDGRYKSHNERAREFRRLKWGSERKFYRIVEQLRRDYGGFLGDAGAAAGPLPDEPPPLKPLAASRDPGR